VVCQPAGHLW